MYANPARRSSMVAIGLSIAFWVFMAWVADSDVGAMIGFVLAFGLAMFIGPLLVLGPLGLLLALVLAPALIASVHRKISGWWPLVIVHLVGFSVFASKSMVSLDKAWP